MKLNPTQRERWIKYNKTFIKKRNKVLNAHTRTVHPTTIREFFNMGENNIPVPYIPPEIARVETTADYRPP
jgi:hypothetical protein